MYALKNSEMLVWINNSQISENWNYDICKANF